MRRGTVGLILLACAAPRAFALLLFPHPQQTLYLRLAESIALRHAYALDAGTTTYIEPFYPLILAPVRALSGSAVWPMFALHIAIACLGGVALFALARARTSSDRIAWAATLLYAGSPYLVRQSASFMEVTVAATLSIAAVWSIDRVGRPRDAAIAGVVLAALVLTRFSFLPIAVGAVALVAIGAGAARALIVAAVALAGVAPWMAFSRATDGTLLPPRIGENLFESTSEWAERVVPHTNVDVLLPLIEEMVHRELAPSYSAADRDRLLFEHARSYARAYPLRVAMSKVRNLGWVFVPRLLPFTERRGSAALVDGVLTVPPQAPRPLPYEIIAGAYQALLLGGAVIGVWKRRVRLAADAMLIVVAVSVIAVNVAFYPTSRLLAPMSFVPMFYTAVACFENARGPA